MSWLSRSFPTCSLPTMSAPVAEKKKIEVPAAPALITLAGKVAIVTGGGRGIGSATSTRLARDGAKVIVNYVSSATDAAAVVATIKAAGGEATAVQADVSTVAGADRVFAEAKRIYGKVDILVANAGAMGGGPFATLEEKSYDSVFNTNVKGVAFLFKNAATLLERDGRVIVLGSVLHRGSSAGTGPYAATKAAVAALAAALAIEVAPKNITVNTVHAGPTDTELLRAAAPAEQLAAFAATSPFKRLGHVGDIADAISLLVSEQARWITGQALLVTGGLKD